MGFSVFQANLLTIPSQFIYGVQVRICRYHQTFNSIPTDPSPSQLLVISWLSERFNERTFIASISNIWFLPWLIALVALGSTASDWVRYALLSGLLSYPYCHAILVAWNSRNSNSVRTRAVSAALYNMFVQSGNIIASNIYREEDRPYYIKGNKVLLAINCYNLALFVFVKYYYVKKNARRQRAWERLTGEEKVEYVRTTDEEGAKRLDFRFAH
jgi:hypothetical protein